MWFSVTRPRSQASLSRQKLNSHIKKEKGFPTVNFRVWVDNFTHNHFTGSVCCCSGQLTAAQIHLSSEWFGLISELYDDIKPTEKHPTPPVSTTLINKIKYALIRYQFLWLISIRKISPIYSAHRGILSELVNQTFVITV